MTLGRRDIVCRIRGGPDNQIGVPKRGVGFDICGFALNNPHGLGF